MATIKNSDSQERPPLSPFSPRLAGALFFAFYGLLLMFFTKYTIFTLAGHSLFPLLQSIPLAFFSGLVAGICFGKMLAKPGSWWRPFLIGLLLACLAIILGSLLVLVHGYLRGSPLISRLQGIKDYLVIYGAILASLAITIGTWFIPLTGLASVYFNKKFFPGLKAADKERINTDKHDS